MTREDYFTVVRERINAIKLISGEVDKLSAVDPVDTGAIHALAEFIIMNATELREATGKYVTDSVAAKFNVASVPMLSDGGKVSKWSLHP